MNLILLGAPGTGKGTQAERLAKKTGVAHLSTGDLLRRAVRDGTELGRQTETYMKAGELVPDGIIIGLIEAKMNDGTLAHGVVLDGFPRTIPQAEALDMMFERTKSRIDRAILLTVDDEEIVKRLSGRMNCPECHIGYHYPMQMPRKEGICDRCGGTLMRRPDDELNVVRNRLEVYKKQSRPIEEYYRRQSILLEIDGFGSPDMVSERIQRGLGIDN